MWILSILVSSDFQLMESAWFCLSFPSLHYSMNTSDSKWGRCRDFLICFLFLGDYVFICLTASVWKSIVSYILMGVFCCFRQGGQSGSVKISWSEMTNPLLLLRYHHLFSAKVKTIIHFSLLCLFGETTLLPSPFLLPNIFDSCFLSDTKNFQSDTFYQSD